MPTSTFRLSSTLTLIALAVLCLHNATAALATPHHKITPSRLLHATPHTHTSHAVHRIHAESRTLQPPTTADRLLDAQALAASLALGLATQPALAADTAWVAPAKAVLTPLFAVYTLLFLFRTVLSWFPKYNLNEPPWNIAAWPTEPILKVTRQVIPPVAGVDITPIVWVAIISFFNEILLGPQGLFTIIQKKG